ncbi:hypothetical protein [Filomicrobium insigne]|uniref:hypothetical protein n=1 Tax=Filomicrobium insigne TaxID=418854 RepID=UPI000B7F5824|nr:hypothetical protein [Filomicrobium insigne]
MTVALFACAAMVKYFPLVLLPTLLRRWDWRLPTALIVTAGLLFIPYAGSGHMFGFLGTHLGNEGYRDGWGFQIVWFLRDFSIADPSLVAYLLFAGGLIGLLAVWAVFARGPDEFLPNRMALLGAAFLFLTSPHYPWYFAFFVRLVRTDTSPGFAGHDAWMPDALPAASSGRPHLDRALCRHLCSSARYMDRDGNLAGFWRCPNEHLPSGK